MRHSSSSFSFSHPTHYLLSGHTLPFPPPCVGFNHSRLDRRVALRDIFCFSVLPFFFWLTVLLGALEFTVSGVVGLPRGAKDTTTHDGLLRLSICTASRIFVDGSVDGGMITQWTLWLPKPISFFLLLVGMLPVGNVPAHGRYGWSLSLRCTIREEEGGGGGRADGRWTCVAGMLAGWNWN